MLYAGGNTNQGSNRIHTSSQEGLLQRGFLRGLNLFKPKRLEMS